MTLEQHLRQKLDGDSHLRNILWHDRLRKIAEALGFGTRLPRPPFDLFPPLTVLDMEKYPYTQVFSSEFVEQIPKPPNIALYSSGASGIIPVTHQYDGWAVIRAIHQQRDSIWPIIVEYTPTRETLIDRYFLELLCNALADTWLRLLKSLLTVDLLMGNTGPLLASLLWWSCGGTRYGVARALDQASPFPEREYNPNPRTEGVLVDRLAKLIDDKMITHPSDNALLHWLSLFPPTYEDNGNLFLVLDAGMSESGVCRADDPRVKQLSERGCVIKLVTRRPDYYETESLLTEPIRWEAEDIESVLLIVSGEEVGPLELLVEGRWQDEIKSPSIELAIAKQAQGSIGRAIVMANDIFEASKYGDEKIEVERITKILDDLGNDE